MGVFAGSGTTPGTTRATGPGTKATPGSRGLLSTSIEWVIAKLSAQSFDEFNKAQRQEQEGEKLVEQGNQKLVAADILKQKAADYEELAKS